jgi:hypothetical protein
LSNCSESSLFKWSLMILETWLRLTILYFLFLNHGLSGSMPQYYTFF